MALLSCFVFEEQIKAQPRLRKELAGPLRQRQVCKLSMYTRLFLMFSGMINTLIVEQCRALLYKLLCV